MAYVSVYQGFIEPKIREVEKDSLLAETLVTNSTYIGMLDERVGSPYPLRMRLPLRTPSLFTVPVM